MRRGKTTTKRGQRRECGQFQHRWVYPGGFHLALDVAPLGVVTRTASIDEALEATRKTEFDLAILDADLNGRSVSPVADALVARDIGFVFVTGSDHGLYAYRDRPTLKKPFQIDALKRCCKSALSSH